MQILTGLAALLAVLTVSSASFANETYSALFRARSGVTTAASGTALLELDESETQLSFDIRISGLGSPELAAHIHAPDGSILTFLPPGEVKIGVWSNPGTLAVAWLRTGQLYILVHTEGNPSGEIRGDIAPGPLVPVTGTSFGAVKALFAE